MPARLYGLESHLPTHGSLTKYQRKNNPALCVKQHQYIQRFCASLMAKTCGASISTRAYPPSEYCECMKSLELVWREAELFGLHILLARFCDLGAHFLL
jgi:hypothetical protein